MALFLSTFVNKVDRKGRVSVPAPFRAVLAAHSFAGIVAYPSFVSATIEACGLDRMEELSRGIDQLNPFGDQHDAFASALFAESHQLAWDAEGRVVLPDRLCEAAGITDLATFVGRGPTFQIWEPGAAQENQAQARERARSERDILRLPGRGGDGEGR